MRLLSISLSLAFLALGGCSEQPLGPQSVGFDTNGDQLAKSGATKTVGTFEYDADGWEFYLECMDETVTYFGRLDFELTTVATPSGNTKTTWKGLYSYPYGFTSSGGELVWDMVHGTQTAQDLVKADGTYQTHFSLHEWYKNQHGEKMLQVATYGGRTNPEGELVFEKFHGWCPGQPDEVFSPF